ncbi:hypothetical protein Syun_000495 [Stephania yunnanensis]|uniref:Protein kinase domain-containing protein n=1 Tax=Stephania yunnanensis TaxID=152371 RepID=A0AAP0Q5M0_9MAGN
MSGITFMVRRRKKSEELLEDWEVQFGPHRFMYKAIFIATKGFGNTWLLGRGGFGRVYNGELPSSKTQIAVKRVSHESSQGTKEFIAEIATIGRLRHPNLVRLLGYSRRKGELLLVYDFMPNDSLDKFIFSKANQTLNWFQRFKIIKDIATGLAYLHEEWVQVSPCSSRYLHTQQVRKSMFSATVRRLHREGKLMSGADLRLGGEFDEGEMRKVFLIGLVCSHPDPLQRPAMRGVVQMLGGDVEVPIVPTIKPSMSFISTSQLLLILQDTTDSISVFQLLDMTKKRLVDCVLTNTDEDLQSFDGDETQPPSEDQRNKNETQDEVENDLYDDVEEKHYIAEAEHALLECVSAFKVFTIHSRQNRVEHESKQSQFTDQTTIE